MIVSSRETSHQGFSSVGEPIREIAEYIEKLHQDHVDRQDVVTELSALVGKESDGQHQQDAADHEVGVHLEETLQLVGLQQNLLFNGDEVLPVFRQHENDGGEQTDVLCDDGAQRHTSHAHLEYVDEQDAQPNVDCVDQDGDDHGDGGVLHTDVPAVEGVETQYSRRRPDSHTEIIGGVTQHLVAAVEQLHGNPFDGSLQGEHQHGGNQCDAHGAVEAVGDLLMVVATVCLCGEACRSSPHEAEDGVHHAEDGAAETDGTDIRNGIQMPHQHHVHQAQQRHGDVADDVRDRQLQDTMIQLITPHSSLLIP